jgi:hypothetical protein
MAIDYSLMDILHKNILQLVTYFLYLLCISLISQVKVLEPLQVSLHLYKIGITLKIEYNYGLKTCSILCRW